MLIGIYSVRERLEIWQNFNYKFIDILITDHELSIRFKISQFAMQITERSRTEKYVLGLEFQVDFRFVTIR